MAINYVDLIPEIDRVLERIAREARQVQALILTESDLKCIVYKYLTQLLALAGSSPTRDEYILGTPVHTEVSWFDERGRLSITPDITILEPEHLSILYGDTLDVKDEILPSRIAYQQSLSELPREPGRYRRIRERQTYEQLPSKGFSFNGKAITFELKFARHGIQKGQWGGTTGWGIMRDFKKMMDLFRILDRRGEGDSLFSYLVIFDRFDSRARNPDFASFLDYNTDNARYKIVYFPLQ